MPATVPVQIIANHDNNPHTYRVYEPPVDTPWLSAVASEYIALRTKVSAPIPPGLIDGIDALEMTVVMAHLQAATIPPRGAGNLDVVRSDFGEVISYVLLEQEFGSQIGYKSIRDRELINAPGRGIDVIGVEVGDTLTLLLGETKVSNENNSPPGVVDSNTDSLRNQHCNHLSDLAKTKRKVWDVAGRAANPALRSLFFTAALLLQKEKWAELRMIVCCTLIRPKAKYSQADFGTFKASPQVYSPAQVRFLIFCVPGEEIDPVIDAFHTMAMAEGV